ncbi:MAG TPA: efflux RND transporter periplasmic adaptor subunit [Gemmataceae bacterium]|nr:efflux RND transporter periplasmic adaptor subunit [Gemmataceae bacterium]
MNRRNWLRATLPAVLAVVLVGLTWTAGSAGAPAREAPVALPTCVNIEQAEPPAASEVTGVVVLDGRKLVRVCARTDGRIEKLHVKATGGRVKQGDLLAEIRCPDLMATTQNLLDARRAGNGQLEKIARERLRLWGLDDGEVAMIVLAGKPTDRLTVRSPTGGRVVRQHQAEGDFFKEGDRLFDVADLSTVWVEAVTRGDVAAPFLVEGQVVIVRAKTFPNRVFAGEVIGTDQDDTTRALKIRFAVDNLQEELRPGMSVTVSLAPPMAPADPELAKAKRETAGAAYKATFKAFQDGRADTEKVYLWSRRWMEAEQDAGEKKADRIAAVEAHLDRMKELRKLAEARYQAGQSTHADVLGVDFYLAEARLWLAQAKAE